MFARGGRASKNAGMEQPTWRPVTLDYASSEGPRRGFWDHVEAVLYRTLAVLFVLAIVALLGAFLVSAILLI